MTPLRNPWQSYQKVSTHTASPGRLVLMLYEGAIRFLERALEGFQLEDPLEFNLTIHNNVQRAQQILDELNQSLDLQNGGDLATTLRGLYLYLDGRLTESNMRKQPAGIEETLMRLRVLRDAWSEMLQKQGTIDASAEGAEHTLSTCG